MAAGFASLTVPLIIVGCVTATAIALTRSRPLVVLFRSGLVVAISMTAAIVVKDAVPRPVLTDVVILNNSFPSGTVTAVAGAVAALVLATPRDMRVLTTAPGVVAVAATSYMVVALRWHRPSDVIGALFLVGGVTLVVTAFTVRAPVNTVIADASRERLIDRHAAAICRERQGDY